MSVQTGKFKPGSLVKARDRNWIVLPSENDDLVRLKPLGGSEDETTGIYLPLANEKDTIKTTEFPPPGEDDIGDITTARILHNASRLSFRNGAGPFRSLAKLSFRPRSYQMVPLIMALKQDPVRLLIADDVGVGKTIEALLIVKEMLERREIRRFAVICLPHLCDQWQAELKDKFGIDAVIIRSNTQARLDRAIHGDMSVYEYYPYQVISIDYIKSDVRRQVFIQQCPEMIVVDEAHTCARPSGAQKSQQQRHSLLYDISRKDKQHLLLLTATPHSGKPDEFQSLLGLINPEFEKYNLPDATQSERKKLAMHFVKRRRADVERWLNEETTFPRRDSGEHAYDLSPAFAGFYHDMRLFAQKLMRRDKGHRGQDRMRYWTALALLRGIMSSPAAGVEMLRNRMKNDAEIDEQLIDSGNPVLDEDYGSGGDYTPIGVVESAPMSRSENTELTTLAGRLEKLQNLDDDTKAYGALQIIHEWLRNGYNPVIFCRYIATARYLGELLAPLVKKKHKGVSVQVITSEDPDDVRKERIIEMGKSPLRVLIATECLSEGINLQDYFTAVLHYDLPWNPNRLEQREGRVDRFGQMADEVKAYLYYSKDNPIDGVVFRVLLQKVREIRRSIGISLPLSEDSKTIMDAVLNAVLLNPKMDEDDFQLKLFDDEKSLQQYEVEVTRSYEEAAAREKQSHTIFAQHTIKADEIEEDLKQADDAIGDQEAVEDFVVEALRHLGVQIDRKGQGYILYTTNLPPILGVSLHEEGPVKVSFDSPTPEGYMYLGRNHLFVEQLCQYCLALAVQHGDSDTAPSRASVIRSDDVSVKTTILLFRVRNVIEDKEDGRHVIAEEMMAWGYRGVPGDEEFLNDEEAMQLLFTARPAVNMTPEEQRTFFENELTLITPLQEEGDVLDSLALDRARKLVEAHERFRKLVSGSKFRAVTPVLPMDIMGIYILLPRGNTQ